MVGLLNKWMKLFCVVVPGPLALNFSWVGSFVYSKELNLFGTFFPSEWGYNFHKNSFGYRDKSKIRGNHENWKITQNNFAWGASRFYALTFFNRYQASGSPSYR